MKILTCGSSPRSGYRNAWKRINTASLEKLTVIRRLHITRFLCHRWVHHRVHKTDRLSQMSPFNIKLLNSHTLHFHSAQIISSVPFSDTLRTDTSFRSYKTACTIEDHQMGIRSQVLPIDLTPCIHHVLMKIWINRRDISANYTFRCSLSSGLRLSIAPSS